MNPKLKKYQIAMRRAPDGKVLGVFKGIAQSLGWSVCGTRAFGCVILLSIAGAFGVEGFSASILAVGFFYLLLAMLMRPPATSGVSSREDAELDLTAVYPPRREDRRRSSAAAEPVITPQRYTMGRRVDLAQMDRQLDGLNRRIQRMETIVTDRQYDWDRRMNS